MFATFDRSRTGITGGRADDHHAFATFCQHVVEQAAEQLQGKVLERQSRAVEQLQHPFVTIELTQRRYSGVGKRTVGFFENLFEVGIRNAAGQRPSAPGFRQPCNRC